MFEERRQRLEVEKDVDEVRESRDALRTQVHTLQEEIQGLKLRNHQLREERQLHVSTSEGIVNVKPVYSL